MESKKKPLPSSANIPFKEDKNHGKLQTAAGQVTGQVAGGSGAEKTNGCRERYLEGSSGPGGLEAWGEATADSPGLSEAWTRYRRSSQPVPVGAGTCWVPVSAFAVHTCIFKKRTCITNTAYSCSYPFQIIHSTSKKQEKNHGDSPCSHYSQAQEKKKDCAISPTRRGWLPCASCLRPPRYLQLPLQYKAGTEPLGHCWQMGRRILSALWELPRLGSDHGPPNFFPFRRRKQPVCNKALTASPQIFLFL